MYVNGWWSIPYIYIYGILFIHEKHNNVIYSNMDYHTKWSKPDWERQISYDIAYMWSLKEGYKWTKLGDWDWHIHTIIYKTDI